MASLFIKVGSRSVGAVFSLAILVFATALVGCSTDRPPFARPDSSDASVGVDSTIKVTTNNALPPAATSTSVTPDTQEVDLTGSTHTTNTTDAAVTTSHADSSEVVTSNTSDVSSPDAGAGPECREDDGLRACGDACIPATDCCGDSDCPSSGTCDDGACTCASDMHVCDHACVNNDAVATCGASCKPCPVPTGGTATCDGSECGATCPKGKALCLGACIDETEACSDECPTGTRNCDGFCTELDSVTDCGPSCATCAAPDNATPTCVDDACAFDCKSGYKECNGVCIPSSTCCIDDDCTGDLTCNASNVCTCPSGEKHCGSGLCVPNDGCCAATDCSGDLVCASNVCTCGDGEKQCGTDQCVPTAGCCGDTDCDGDLVCGDTATCGCPSNEKSCGGDVCVANSGCCDDEDCGGNLTCNESSMCACPSDTKACGSDQCIPTSDCCNNNDCEGQLVCTAGSCECPSDQKSCGGSTCVLNSGCCDVNDCNAGLACNNGQCVDVTPPQITAITPTQGTRGVTSTTPVVITFSEAMNQNSVASAFTLNPPVNASLSWNPAGTQLTVTPTGGFAYAEGDASVSAQSYSVFVGTSATDPSGNPLVQSGNTLFYTLRRITENRGTTASAFWGYSTIANGATCGIDSITELLVGDSNGRGWSGQFDAYAQFDMSTFPTISNLESAEFRARPTSVDTDFYPTWTVGLELLEYVDIEPLQTEPPSLTVLTDHGAFPNGEVTNLTMDVTSSVLPHADDDLLLFRMRTIVPSIANPVHNQYMRFSCSASMFLYLTYLEP